MPQLPLKHQPIDVPPGDPFKNDTFDRKKLVDPLTTLLETADHPFVLAITGAWGSGKTTFLCQWSKHLRNQNWAVIEFNAWTNDFSESALATMIAELRDGVDELRNQGGEPGFTQAVQKVRKVGAALAKRLVPAVVRVATRGALNVDEELEGVAADVAETVTLDVISHYEQTKQCIAKFKDALTHLVTKLKPRRLVIVVDELDRCRPPYSLEMLECMKHLFDVDGVVFVVGLDMSQLQATVAAVYGQAIDAREYLRKFIDMQFSLPLPTSRDLASALWHRAGLHQVLLARDGYDEAERDLANMLHVLARYIELFPRSVRFYEHIMTRLSAVMRTLPANYYTHSEVLVFLVVLRELHADTYNELRRRWIKPADAMNTLFADGEAKRFCTSKDSAYLEALLIVACTTDFDSDLSKYRAARDVSADKFEKARLSQIVSYCEKYSFERMAGFLDRWIQKIELSDRFVDPMAALE